MADERRFEAVVIDGEDCGFLRCAFGFSGFFFRFFLEFGFGFYC